MVAVGREALHKQPRDGHPAERGHGREDVQMADEAEAGGLWKICVV